jgi:hypothetical protein
MKIYSLICSLLIFSFCQTTAQQYVDILSVSHSISAQNPFDSTSQTSHLQESLLDFTFPIPLNEQTALLTGLNYERVSSQVFLSDQNLTVSSITAKIGLNRTHSDRWSGTYVLLPKIASDFESIGKNDFQIGAVALFKRRKSEKLNFSLGVYANTERFGPFAVPLFGMYYLSPNDKFECKLLIPLNADINYKLHKNVAAGIMFKGQIRSYHLNAPTPSIADAYLTRSTNDVHAFLRFQIAGGWMIETKAGHSVGRKYRVFEESDKVPFALPLAYFDDNRTQLNNDFSDGLLFEVALRYRFDLSKGEE